MTPIFEYKGYSGSAEINVVDNLLHGRLLFISDIVTYAAENPRALKIAFEEAVDDYLQTCAELGDIPNIPATQSIKATIVQWNALAEKQGGFADQYSTL